MVAPFLVLLLFGGVELSRMVLAQIKNTRVASTVSDLVTRADSVTENDLNDILTSGRAVGSPFDYQTNGRIIVSSVIAVPSDGPRIVWQRSFPPNAVNESRLGRTGGLANLANGFTMRDGENVIVSEALFDYEPLSNEFLFENSQMYAQATNRPRGAILDNIE